MQISLKASHGPCLLHTCLHACTLRFMARLEAISKVSNLGMVYSVMQLSH